MAEILETRQLLSTLNDNFIQGTVFVDNDHSGTPNVGDIFQSGVTMQLTSSDGAPMRTTITDANGHYLFDKLPAVDGSNHQITYTVSEVVPNGFAFASDSALTQLDNATTGNNQIIIQFPTASTETAQFAGLLGNTIGAYINGIPDTPMASQIAMNVTPTASGGTTTVQTFCININSELEGFPYTSFTGSLHDYLATQKSSGPIYDGQIAWLYNNYGTATPQPMTVPSPGGPLNATSTEVAMGLQLAIWKMEYDPVDFTNPDASFKDSTSKIYIDGVLAPVDPGAYWAAVNFIKLSANQQDLAMVLNFDAAPNVFAQQMILTNSFNFINTKSPLQPKGSISGAKFDDLTGNGLSPDDTPLGGVTIDLFADTDHNGVLDSGDTKVGSTVTAPVTGAYSFGNLNAGTYFVKEEVPNGFTMTTPVPAPIGAGYYTVNLGPGINAGPYNFADYAGKFGQGDSATIGFWANKNGQALINSLNGGSQATQLATWLNTNFPNLYPTSLIGTTNANVADYFETIKGQTGNKLEAQIMAVALASYVTDATLAGGYYAQQYGFNVSQSGGTGFMSFNSESSGSVLGLQNNTNYTILTYLQAANALAVGGTLFAGDAATRGIAVIVFNDINTKGDII